jgi:membrane-bound metal-dependent hydrolase YbcI (DUF457 family)
LSWVLGERVLKDNRDVALVAAAGILPDIDSAGVVLDLANSLLGRPPTEFYASLHHFLLHGAAGALAVSALLSAAGRERARVFALSLVTFHLHLLCDVVGSRGPDPSEGIWPIYYLGPFTSRAGVLVWQDQWLLNGWQNVSLTIALLAWTFYVAWRWDRSPFLPWAGRVHAAFVEALRRRFGEPCAGV